MIIHDIKFLGGRVHKRSLPTFPPPAPLELAEKRLLLPQGELAQFYNGEEPVRYIAAIEFVKGTVRGNHYHQRKQEWVYLVTGAVQLVVEDLRNNQRETVPMAAGDLAYISPGIAHAFVVQENGMAVEYSPVRFDPTDNIRYSLT